MKSTKLVPLAVLGTLAFGALAPHAQNTAQKLAYVDVQSVLKAHPKYGELDALNKQAQAALKPTQDKIAAIQQKGNNATAADRQTLDALAKTYQADAQKWQKQIQDKTDPVLAQVNTAVAATAKAQGVTMVLDKNIAATSGLVIYADEKSLDLTSAVSAQLKK
ncbi:OmpH family outer membrane protein [Deinococcus pimensis]|uniref:OmpH family outer membrane protein n=1 Tax=Deinococcus pimensis TaxID=309888 RepID=UPI0004812CAE|nr:OmpH family outer membrane protein [Deinococcus pimensis]